MEIEKGRVFNDLPILKRWLQAFATTTTTRTRTTTTRTRTRATRRLDRLS
jgi:hypothetical protein